MTGSAAPLSPLEPWIAQLTSGTAHVDRAALERFQLERLHETLRYVHERSPFYRRKLAGTLTEPASLRELAQLPFTTPADIRDNPLQFLCVSQDAIQRIVTLDSSGTTGEPKRIAFTREDQELTLDFFQVGMATFTGAEDTVLILLPTARPGSAGALLATALERLGARSIARGPLGAVPETLALIRREQVSVIVGMPVQVLLLARHPLGQGLKLKSVLLTADHVPDAIVAALEQSWGCVVYNHYGMTEMGLGGGVECAARRGYHLREADLLFEIIDPTTGLPVAEGQPGEIVFTTLTRRGMPLVRYRTGDFSRFIAGKCACGSGLKTLERVRQRLSGIVPITDKSRLTMADLDEALFPITGLVDFTAQLQRGERAQLHIEALLLPGQGDNAASSVRNALGSIPAIIQARQDGALTTAVTTSIWHEGITPQLGKRTIMMA